MPTPHGSRGGMAFSADELRVLRRALAQALQPSIPTGNTSEDVQDLLRLADTVDEAAREGGRLRTFLSAELVRYRAALPGSASGYLERLRGALESGYVPQPDDLAALRRLRTQSCTPAEERRRTSMLRRCEHIAELDVRARLERRVPAPVATFTPRPRLLALPGGRGGRESGNDKNKDVGKEKEAEKQKQKEKPETETERESEKGTEKEKGPAPEPGRGVPTPAEVWPPRRRPAPPAPEPRKPAPPSEQRRGA